MKPEEVKAKAAELVARDGLINLSRAGLCAAVGLPVGSFQHVMGCTFGDFVEQLRDEGAIGASQAITKTRVPGEFRKAQILEVALEMAILDGYDKLTSTKIAEKAGISTSLVAKYFKTMTQLRGDVMRAAIKREILPVIAQGIVSGDKRAKALPQALKQRALLEVSA